MRSRDVRGSISYRRRLHRSRARHLHRRHSITKPQPPQPSIGRVAVVEVMPVVVNGELYRMITVERNCPCHSELVSIDDLDDYGPLLITVNSAHLEFQLAQGQGILEDVIDAAIDEALEEYNRLPPEAEG